MDRIKIITHKGKSIVKADLSNFNVNSKKELEEAIVEIQDFIAKQPLGSILIITDVTGIRFDLDIIKMFVEFTGHNKPYIKASAVIGIADLLSIALNSVIRNAIRDIHSFNTQEQALDWLVEQG